MSEVESLLNNTGAERMVRTRYALALLLLVPIEVLATAAVVDAPRGRPVLFEPEKLALVILSLVLVTLVVGYFLARVLVFVSVPRTVSVRAEGVVGDFRRETWRGDPYREIRFENVSALRRARLLRVPMVFGTSGPSVGGAIRAAPFFYLTATNFAIVHSAYQRWRQTLATVAPHPVVGRGQDRSG